MFSRVLLLCCLFFSLLPNAFAAECLTVFPSGWRQLPPANEQLINFPANNSGTQLGGGTTLPRGDNLYLSSGLANNDELFVGPVVNSETTARLFFRTSVSWNNVKINENGNPEDLIIVIDGSLQLTGGDTLINAIVYVKGSLSVSDGPVMNGAITVLGNANYINVNYDSNYIANADFNGMCDNTPEAVELIANFRFDECEYTGANFEVIDQTGDYSATSFSDLNTNDQGKIERFADISDKDHHIETSIPLPSSFTVSTWFKKPSSNSGNAFFVLGAMQNGGDLLYLDRSDNWRWGVYNPDTGSQDGTFSFASLDNNWHHLVLVFSAGQTQLYIDGSLEDSVNIVPEGTLKYIGTSFDDVNSSNAQGFRAPLDEFMVFDSTLSASEIQTLYDNQNAENNYDGSSREPVSCFKVLANYRFDECKYTGANFEVIDQTGNYSATSFSDLNTNEQGLIERFADISSKDHHIETSILLPTSFTVSTWFKKQTSNIGNSYFVLGAMQNGGDLLYIDRTNNWRWGVYNPDTGSQDGTFSFASLDNNWHHLVLVFSVGQTQLYIDGSLEDSVNIAPEGTLKYIGTSFDDVNSSNAQGFRAPLDEFMVFDSTLSASEIQTLYDNQNAQKNYDGTNRDTVNCSALIAEYRFDESSWSGQVGEVIDEIGRFHAQSKNDANTLNATPAIVGNPGTCRYGAFDGVNDYVALPASFDNQQGSFTITAWINPSNSEQGSIIFADDENNSQGYAFSLGDPGSGKLRFYSRGVTPISVDTLASVIPTDTWTFVAAVHDADAKTRAIYVNGVAQTVTGGGLSNTYSGSWGLDNGIASIGGETDSGETNNRFTGAIDEVRMYQGALTGAEIAVIQNETHPCDSFIDHFEINHDGQGLTCEAESISIKACADASCSTLSNDAADVQLSINGSVNQTVTVSGGSTSTSFSYADVGTATLSLDQTFACKNGASTSCDIVFSDAGFRFFSNIEGTLIPMQLSGKPSNLGFEASTLKLQAIKKNPDSGACQAAFINTKAIEMAATCVDPVACAGSQVAINNLSTTTHINTLNINALLSYSSVGLDFSDNTVNNAEFVFTYPDAGKIQLHVRYNIPDENGDPSGNYMMGTSNAFVVRPFGFYVDVSGNPKAQTAAGDKFIAAGENFTTSLTAVQWQSGQDVDNNGVPDIGVDLSINTTTLNFGSEVSPETAMIDRSLLLPNPGQLGDLGNNSFAGFVNGKATVTDMTYDEVGIISFSANLTDNSYLGTDDIVGNEPYVGRFIPEHFVLVRTNGDLAAYCDNEAVPEAMGFAYSGQMSTATPSRGGVIRYSLNPSFTITAKSKGGGKTTKNYTGDFMKLEASGITRLTPNEDYTTEGALGNKMALTADLKVITTSDLQNNENEGVITYSFHDDDNFVYTHEKNAEINKFPSDINLQIKSVIDSDLVEAEDADDDFDGGDPANALDSVLTLEPTEVEVRFGRAYLANSFGPETSTLPQELTVQYFEGGKYILAEDDICSLYNSSNVSFGATNEVSIDVAGLQAANGKFDDPLDEPDGATRAIMLPAAGVNNRGEVEVIYDIYDWLKFDWAYDDEGIDGEFNDNPRATATFGLFRGNDRIIYQREVIN